MRIHEYEPGDIKFQAALMREHAHYYTGPAFKTKPLEKTPDSPPVKTREKVKITKPGPYWNHNRAIIEATCHAFDLKPKQIFRKSRVHILLRARGMVYYLMRTRTKQTFPQIAMQFAKDHSTIVSAVNNVKADKWGDAHMADDINAHIDKMYQAYLKTDIKCPPATQGCVGSYPPCSGEM